MNIAQIAVATFLKTQQVLKLLVALQLTTYLWPQNVNIEEQTGYDFIIIGAGSAGCVLASRLSEVEHFKVLLVEAGPVAPFESTVPSIAEYMKRSQVDWNHTSENDGYTFQFSKQGVSKMSHGKMMGGSSALNNMMYIRGSPHDFQLWAKAANDSSWLWENLLPYFIKSERLEDPAILSSTNKVFHGTTGYLGITRQPFPGAQIYLKAFKELGHKILLDANGDDMLGYTEPTYTIADGVRQSSAYSFITPIKNRPNLHLLKNTLASKVIFDHNKNAVGVELITENGKLFTVNSRKEVIVSAGAINTPQLLMLSGIGPDQHLKKMKITTISNLPVAANFQNHHPVALFFKMTNLEPKSRSLDPHKWPGTPFITGYVALNKSQNYPDYQTLAMVQNPESLLVFCAVILELDDSICEKLYRDGQGGELLLTHVCLLHPKSRGSILLRSTNPLDPPLIYPGYYSNDDDLEKQVSYLEDFLRVLHTETLKDAGVELIDLTENKCGSLKRGSKEFWKCYILCMMEEFYHYTGTCSLGTVVDSKLQVLGVNKLRIADASVIPYVTSGNTNAPTMMIGEKAADIIKSDYEQ